MPSRSNGAVAASSTDCSVMISVTSVIGGILGYASGYCLYATVGQAVIECYGLQEVAARVQGWINMLVDAGNSPRHARRIARALEVAGAPPVCHII